MGRERRVDEGSTRGSRRHVLDWVSSPDFPERLTALLEPTGAVVSAGDVWMPRGWDAPNVGDLGTSFEDHAHWERCFLEHARGVLPRELLERRIELGTGSMSLILRTLEAPAGDAAAGRTVRAGR